MDPKNRPGTIAQAAQGAGQGEDSGTYAIFESLEQLREAQAGDAAASAKPAEDGSLEAVLTHYKDWLRTLG